MNRLVLSLIFIFSIASEAAARAKTNVNEVTDLFEQNIVGKKELFEQLEMDKVNGISRLESGEGPSAIEGSSDRELEISKLGGIKAIDLDGMGREKRNSAEYKFYDENELEPNWSKSGNKMHKQDANRIAEATAKTLGNLMTKLKDLGLVDCRTVKGPTAKEPVYHIDLRKEELTNTEYDQFFCEELRNSYNCRDEVKLACTRKGKRYGEWQARTINFIGHELYHGHIDWGWSVKLEYKNHIWHIHNCHPQFSESRLSPQQINDQARNLIAARLAVDIEQIHEEIGFPEGGRGIGNITPLYSRWRQAWDYYVFSYLYRDAYDVCEEWQEDWVERCKLQG